MLTNSAASLHLVLHPEDAKTVIDAGWKRCIHLPRQTGGGSSTSSGPAVPVLEVSNVLLSQNSSSLPTLRAMRMGLLSLDNSSKLLLGLQPAKKSKTLSRFPDSVQYRRLLRQNLRQKPPTRLCVMKVALWCFVLGPLSLVVPLFLLYFDFYDLLP